MQLGRFKEKIIYQWMELLEETRGEHCLILREDHKTKIKVYLITKSANLLRVFLFEIVKHFSMKKFVVILSLVLFIGVGALFIPEQEVDCDYLRLHIRANSNNELDQKIKYEIKDVLIEFLTPSLCNVQSKEKAIEIVNNNSNLIKAKCLELLNRKCFNYSVNIKISNEYFPTRTYANTTLESGYYDAVVVELGEAVGDNWWCVMYPPLCFVNKNENQTQIKYKSIIYEWFKKIF